MGCESEPVQGRSRLSGGFGTSVLPRGLSLSKPAGEYTGAFERLLYELPNVALNDLDSYAQLCNGPKYFCVCACPKKMRSYA